MACMKKRPGAEDRSEVDTEPSASKIEPTEGSMAGSTMLIIHGKKTPITICGKIFTIQFSRFSKGFDPQKNEITRVFFGSDIGDSYDETNKILYFTGNRGLLWETWSQSPKSNLADIESLSTSADNYLKEFLTNGSSLASFNNTGGYSSRVSGFFVAPWDDVYTFHIMSDDASVLYLNTSGNPDGKVKVAECKSWTNKWNKRSEQKSSRFPLTKGQEVYLYALHSDFGTGHYVKIGVSMDDVQHPNAKIGGAVDEKQAIRVSSVALCETQILDMTSCSTSFKLKDGGVTSNAIQPGTVTAESLDKTLADFFSVACEPGARRKREERKGKEKKLRKGREKKGREKRRKEGKREERKGKEKKGREKRIKEGKREERKGKEKKGREKRRKEGKREERKGKEKKGREKRKRKGKEKKGREKRRKEGKREERKGKEKKGREKRRKEGKREEIKEGKREERKGKEKKGREKRRKEGKREERKGKEKKGREKRRKEGKREERKGKEKKGREKRRKEGKREERRGKEKKGGEKRKKEGKREERRGKKKKGGEKRRKEGKGKRKEGRKEGRKEVRKEICFAYRGPIREYISVRLSFTTTHGRFTRWGWYPYGREAISSNWRHVCVDLHDKISKDSWVISKGATERTSYEIEYIRVMRDVKSTDDYFIDEFWIDQSEVFVRPTSLPAMPGGYLIESFSVSQVSARNFSICMTPAKCGTGIPLMAVDGSTVESQTSSSATYKINGVESRVKVERTQSATPPTTGTFDVTYKGKSVKAIPANATAEKLKQLMEERFDVGDLLVQRTGSCSGYTWAITWSSKGGNHPQLEVNGSLSGNQASIVAATVTDGRLFLGPIPGEFLRTPHSLPQGTRQEESIVSVTTSKEREMQFILQAVDDAMFLLVRTSVRIEIVRGAYDQCELIIGIGIVRGAYDQCELINGIGINSGRGMLGRQNSSKSTSVTQCSGPMGSGGSVVMNGNFEVGQLQSQEQRISVTVSGFPAVCNATAQPAPSSTLCDIGVTTAVSGCQVVEADAAAPQSDTCLSFTHKKCSTPIIKEVTPNTGTSQQVITVKGDGFSVTKCQNVLNFGSHACNIISHSETTVTCKIDLSTKPKPGESFEVSLVVKNRGNALIQIVQQAKKTFVLIPRVTSVTPTSGSKGGGTILTLSGDGFSETLVGNTVRIGTAPCLVKTAAYDKITCASDPQPVSSSEPQEVIVDHSGTKSTCLNASCKFTYTSSETPKVNNAQDTDVIGADHILRLSGSGFGTNKSDVSVTIGDVTCVITELLDGSIKCNISGAFAGTHPIKVLHNNKGLAVFNTGVTSSVTVVPSISSISPTESSVEGGLDVEVNGFGFNTNGGQTSVTVKSKQSAIVSVSITRLVFTTPANPAGNAQVVVTSNGITFPSKQITYSDAATPEITTVEPAIATSGAVVTVTGNFPTATTSSSKIKVGDWLCNVTEASTSEIKFTVPANPAGKYPVSLIIDGKGKAKSSSEFSIDLSLTSVSPSESGHGGGRVVTVDGSGFNASTVVKICDNICVHSKATPVTNTQISCEVPQSDKASHGSDKTCAVSVSAGAFQKSLGSSFTYRQAMTSVITSVSPARGGTGGGVVLTIKGTGFSTVKSDDVVTIDGTVCNVTFASATEIRCTTGAHNSTIQTSVRVEVGTNGKAVEDSADFYYVDVWSSVFSWGGNQPPGKGAFVVIKKGQTMLLDMDTPVLKIIVIKGGTFIFDNKDLHLQAEHILITDGGTFRIGTKDSPHQYKATITMHGHVRSKELPVYGAKGIGLREGTLDIHGKHVPITWTRLSQTALAGANQIHLQLEVTWKAGDEIVIAATARSERENEKVTITGVLNGGKTLTIDPPLKYKHISIVQTIAGRTIETCGEVGLLSRNVVIQGSIHDEWTGKIEACPEKFRPGQFQTQTCFQGKHGDDIGSDMFGVQIMVHAPYKSKGMVTARFSYMEVRHAGQAFRLGRYPIHFHTSGEVGGSYVIGCAIHRSFNRAITIHGTNYLVVEHNVVYDILGNAVFVEDGIEQGNTVRFNLGIEVKPSSSALNVDITPAIFWITNANNTISDNAAAGGTHFGFWYQMFERPDGPSFTPDFCPRNVPMKVCSNNTVHSCGRNGLWAFPHYHPQKGGGCKDVVAEPAYFDSLLSWNNERGVELVDIGAVVIRNSIILDNKIAGIEVVMADAKDSPWGGAQIKDTLIISHSDINPAPNVLYTTSGIRTPQTHGLLVSGVTFVNFDQPGCKTAAIQCCAQCSEFHKIGGFETRFEKMTFINSPCRTRFQWEQETVLRDLDGTMTGHAGGFVLPTSGHLPSGICQASAKDSHGGVPGSTCDNSINFRRFAMNKAAPMSLRGKNVMFRNKYGETELPFNIKDRTHPEGWVATLIVGVDYNLTFSNASHLTNISYKATVFEPHPLDRIIIRHNLMQTPDHFETIPGKFQEMTRIPPGTSDAHGAWSFNNDTDAFVYQFSGKSNTPTVNGNYPPRDVLLKVYRCFFLNCVVPTPDGPPGKKPNKVQKWSNPGDWNGTEAGYGGFGGVLPKDGDNVKITSKVWMVLDVQPASLNKVLVEGVLEVNGTDGIVLNATYIFVTGRILVGSPDKPYPSTFTVNLRGSWSSEDNPMNNAPNTGTKALAVFGEMIFIGKSKKPYWTKLSSTAAAGVNSINVSDEVEWSTGDQIVITSTTKEPRQSEVFKILSVHGGKTITLDGNLKYRHKAVTHTVGGWTYTLAADVGLLTRNLKIVGADEPVGSLGQQSFGCRVLVASYSSEGILRKANAKIQDVEFKNCGQLGWTDSYDPRYALSLVDVGDVSNSSSYIRGNSFHHGFNTGIGVFGTNNLVVEDNVIYYTVGPGIRDEGKGNTLIHNLVARSEATSTYKGRSELPVHWPGAIENHKATNPLMFNNTVAGSDRFGFKLDGESCTDGQSRWHGNEVHGAWHGIHLPYKEGLSDCSKISDFLTWENVDYGIFIYPKSSVIVSGIKSIDNPNGVLPNIWGPAAKTHKTANKYFILRDSLIVGTSPGYNCDDGDIIPEARRPYAKQFGPKMAPGGGRLGVTLTFFGSSPASGPTMAWESPMSYPAIYGNTEYQRVTCANFDVACGKRDICITSNPWIGDIMHPVTVSEMSKVSVDSASLFHFVNPGTGWINPSDCVDMDCDGRRQIVVTDLDGSLTGSGVRTTLIPRAEYEWGGDPVYGLGDYRIPNVALTAVDGSRLDVNKVLPNKGIVRGTDKKSTCTWQKDLNGYSCTGIEHLMLIVESLDADTETRRLSPVALCADGYVNLLNGPMDHGWCLGYTCQERLSTFYGVVASDMKYSLYFTSYAPQKVRFHLLNSNETQVVRIGVYYKEPQRKDVYRRGMCGRLYMYPTNADLAAGQFKLKDIPSGAAKDYYYPPLSSISGSNYFDDDSNTLFVIVRGPEPVDIHTSPVVQIILSVQTVTVDEFFKNNLIQNLADLLGCDPSLIRYMDVISASRRRRRAVSGDTKIVMQIANNPDPGQTNSTNATVSQNSTGKNFVGLSSLVTQRAEYALLILQVSVRTDNMLEEAPIPPPVDPTGGVRATNLTGGSANGSVRYDQLMAQEAAKKEESKSVLYLIPCELVLVQEPSGANETTPFASQPNLKVIDCNGQLVAALLNWTVTAGIRPGTGHSNGTISGTVTIDFVNGWANFTDLKISPSAVGYVLDFTISKPTNVKYNASSQPFDVTSRYGDNKAHTTDDAETMTIIIIVIVVFVMVLIVIIIVVYMRWRNNKMSKLSPPPVTPDNCWTHDDDHEYQKEKLPPGNVYEVNRGCEDTHSIESMDTTTKNTAPLECPPTPRVLSAFTKNPVRVHADSPSSLNDTQQPDEPSEPDIENQISEGDSPSISTPRAVTPRAVATVIVEKDDQESENGSTTKVENEEYTTINSLL
ncbi:hypothetical protein QZH41_019065 [Actinostola sp. cb2023]|nr:hypothetical protein QZH41_019065 [Actinostola sp. cb2023]